MSLASDAWQFYVYALENHDHDVYGNTCLRRSFNEREKTYKKVLTILRLYENCQK